MGLSFLGRGSRRAVTAGVMHVVTATIAGGLVGGALGMIGAVLGLDAQKGWTVGTGAVIALTLTFFAPRLTIGRPCQVPRRWSETLPATRLYASWGAMLGSGLATLIPYPAYILALSGELAAGPLVGAIAGAIFGLFRELPALVPLLRTVRPQEAMGVLEDLAPAARAVNVTLVTAGGVGLILIAVA